MKFAVYSRKSVYTGKGESIENQITMCKQYILNRFTDVSEADITVYEEEGFSAKDTARPRFQEMLKEIRQKRFDYVVCYRLDRISRNVSDFSALIEELRQRDIAFICINEEFDTSKPMGKAMMYIASVFAQLERETIAERVRDNMLMLAKTGRWLGGTTPTGFASEKTQEIIMDGKVKSSCKLKENPTEIGIVRTMFEKFLELHSVSGVSKYCIKQNIKSRSGKLYSPLGIREILQNPVYCTADREALDFFRQQNAVVCFSEQDCSSKLGLLSYNKRDSKKKHAPRRPMEKWIVAIGKHKGIIAGSKWVTAQKILTANKATNPKSTLLRNDYALLSGLVFCEKCGHRMFAKTRGGAKNFDHPLFYYICQSKLRGGKQLCPATNLNGRQTDDLVCEYLSRYQRESPAIYQLLENLKRELNGQTHSEPLAALNNRLKKCQGEMNNLVNILGQGNLSPAFLTQIKARTNELELELKNLSGQQQCLQKEACRNTANEKQAALLATSLAGLREHFPTLPVPEKRAFIRSLVHKLIWDGEALHIFINTE